MSVTLGAETLKSVLPCSRAGGAPGQEVLQGGRRSRAGDAPGREVLQGRRPCWPGWRRSQWAGENALK